MKFAGSTISWANEPTEAASTGIAKNKHTKIKLIKNDFAFSRFTHTRVSLGFTKPDLPDSREERLDQLANTKTHSLCLIFFSQLMFEC